MEGTKDPKELTIDELKTLIAQKDKQIADVEAKSLKQISDLKKEVAKKKDVKANPSVTVDGKVYDLIVANPKIVTNSEAIEFTGDDLIANQELCEDLIMRKTGIFVLRA